MTPAMYPLILSWIGFLINAFLWLVWTNNQHLPPFVTTNELMLWLIVNLILSVIMLHQSGADVEM